MKTWRSLCLLVVVVGQAYARSSTGGKASRILLATNVPLGASCRYGGTCGGGAVCVGASSSNTWGTCAVVSSSGTPNSAPAENTTPAQGSSGSGSNTVPHYSIAPQVPAVSSVARLYDYSKWNSTLNTDFVTTIEHNIFSRLFLVAKCTVTQTVPGSINVYNVIALTDVNSTAASEAQAKLYNLLASPYNATDIFWPDFGHANISQVKLTTADNPNLSGAAGCMTSLWTLAAAMLVAALALGC